ncbi:hypothetical protein HW053_001481 [Campylobacter jejuni]|uniref:hypothetical protein n=1 Tax=Campylobacter jejuni TaxID=197 RepID=UPI00073DCE49|nr:hypothetical protein [Campylobacter jejuni]ALW15613.1 hypothetical protein RC26_02660 [Campylobacter jejuni]EFS7927399.1 hypothetical protein [Campylobacter jejuni]MBX1020857.1 hypothetical protein [Campylobacter jejuni]HED5364334.1 hypothetical protein [Campylobacter jejuni]HEG5317647.1 hypothetical protein [Campylobacter jejuni]
MINLLSNALPYLQGLIKNEKIKIVNKYIENVNGFSQEFNLSLEAVAHIQPVNPKELIKLTSGTLDSNSYYKFWIIGDLANVLNSLNKTDCEIIYKNEKYSVFSKEDWSQNGWIMVIGSLKEYNV